MRLHVRLCEILWDFERFHVNPQLSRLEVHVVTLWALLRHSNIVFLQVGEIIRDYVRFHVNMWDHERFHVNAEFWWLEIHVVTCRHFSETPTLCFCKHMRNLKLLHYWDIMRFCEISCKPGVRGSMWDYVRMCETLCEHRVLEAQSTCSHTQETS